MNATVAQSVEQLIRNQQVAGSSPASSSNKKGIGKANSFFVVHIQFKDFEKNETSMRSSVIREKTR